MELSVKMKQLSSSVFVVLANKRDELIGRGTQVFDLSVGTPDLPPPDHAMEALAEAALDPENYKYAIRDSGELIEAVQGWYARRYGVGLIQEEICALLGSQDGLAHLPLTLLNPGDVAIVPDPGYPIFSNGPAMAAARLYRTPLTAQNGYLPDLEAIPADVAHQAKLMTLSYPMNPLGKLAPQSFFEKAIWFARKYDLVILHDNAYSEITYDGAACGSFLSVRGADEVGVEFNSLSKSYNMTGARISFALGNRSIVGALRDLKSHCDYGVFLPVQKAAAAILNGPQDCLRSLRKTYQERRDALIRGLREAGWYVTPPEATMFVWAKLPDDYPDSTAFCMELAERTGVILTPGLSFGPGGEGYVRIALVRSAQDIETACRRIAESGMLK